MPTNGTQGAEGMGHHVKGSIAASLRVGRWLAAWIGRHADLVYRVLVASFAAAMLAGLLLFLAGERLASAWLVVMTIGAVPLALTYAARMAQALLLPALPARSLPKMYATEGIPPEARTLVVVPTLFDSVERARELVMRLEALALASPDANLRFALLSDFADDVNEIAATDPLILDMVKVAVEALNGRWRDDLGDRFFVLHRKRSWSTSEQRWIGWERKRGKLLELSRLLDSPSAKTTYAWMFGDFLELLRRGQVPYVMTLDEQTWLEAGQVLRLLCVAAHPLNRAVFDDRTGRLISGYAVFQPSVLFHSHSERLVGAALHEARSLSAASGTANLGADFHSEALGIGTHRGAGALYDIAAYKRVMEGAFPEETVLQHDILEGFLARTANVPDAFVSQPLPSSYVTQAMRGHRWIRGELQALVWIAAGGPRHDGERWNNGLRGPHYMYVAGLVLAHLAKPAALVVLFCAWTVLPGSALPWILAAFPAFGFALAGLVAEALAWRFHPSAGRRERARVRLRLLGRTMFALGFSVAVLPFESWLVIDALVRSAWRTLVSHRKLLEWPSRQALDSTAPHTRRQYQRVFWLVPVIGGLTLVWVAVRRPSALPWAAPFAVTWLATPWIVWIVDRMSPSGSTELAVGRRSRVVS